ncbi:two-component system activity regulator YycH [Bacilliculturomica massiliensis]|uniref:two-component system activity regulator YycH n=1 Tax=Bacilliculturomica massiliensis TaxID=1917867 RepID=UPI00102F5F39|nr:two-component system activity regulator YycH [Bacilliculturomica massiliensis]
MKKPNTKTIEFFKTVLIVVLFFITVLLLYFFWENATKDAFRFTEMIYTAEEEEAPEVIDTVIPTEITVGFGNGVYTVISDGGDLLWKEALKELKKFSADGAKQSAGLLVSEISEETFREAVSVKYSSIQFQFHYDIPFQEFCKFYDLSQNQSFEKIEGAATVAWSGMGTESILIWQKTGNKYYAIIADQNYTNFEDMISRIETGDHVSYYPANTFFGSSVKSTALLPLSLQSDLLEVECGREGADSSDGKVKDLAESFFGESFDFIRKITDTKGNITYMYGYGQKIFNVNVDGTFEYKEEASGSSGSSPKFFESLDIALSFVASHGSWNSLDGTDMSVYLKTVLPVGEDKKKGYKFFFGMKIGSQNVYFEKSAPIVVEVVNGQVTYYKRDMIDFDQDTAANYRSGMPENTFDPVTVLTENFDYIYDKLSEAGVALAPRENREAAFDGIADSIKAMEIGYVRPLPTAENSGMVLKPCYRITFGKKVILYFDLFNKAEPIGSDREETAGQSGNTADAPGSGA